MTRDEALELLGDCQDNAEALRNKANARGNMELVGYWDGKRVAYLESRAIVRTMKE